MPIIPGWDEKMEKRLLWFGGIMLGIVSVFAIIGFSMIAINIILALGGV